MNNEQKQRMTHELGQWNAAMKSSCSVSDLLAISTRMSALLQELIDEPEPEPVSDCHVYVRVSGLTGSGKSAVAGEIEIAMRAIGLDVEWVDSKSEKRLTHADYTSALELYRPKVRIFEKNIPRTAPPAPSVPDADLEPNREQLTQLLNGVGKCFVEDSVREFLRVWIRDWTAHKLAAQQTFNLARDAELLDALEDEVKSRGANGLTLGYANYAEDGYVLEKGFRVIGRKFIGPRKATLREAIDAAIEAEKGGA